MILIRLDHRWVKNRWTEDQLAKYIIEAINSGNKLIADKDMYTWLHEPIIKETFEKYYVGSIPNIIEDDEVEIEIPDKNDSEDDEYEYEENSEEESEYEYEAGNT